jgi:IS5 family transposase
MTMAQMGFFDLSDRYSSLDAKNDPLVAIDAVVPWEEFRPTLEGVWRKPDSERKSRAGRKPIDAIVMFKALVLSALYNLSDDQIEYQVRDRLSFMRFLGLGLEDRVPDAKTVWLYREALAQAGMVEALFKQFDGYLARQGYIARGGQILDASIVPVPKNRNSRDENKTIKSGEVPEDWENKPAMRSQKDLDARWRDEDQKTVRGTVFPTSKHGKSHYGYKNHVNVDRKHKLVRRYDVTPSRDIAAQCPAGQWTPPCIPLVDCCAINCRAMDSQAVDHLLMRGNTGAGVWADSAYRSEEMEAKLRARKLTSHIHRKGKRPSRACKHALPGSGQAADRTGQGQQPDQIHRAGPGRTCLRRADQRHGRHAGAHDRHGAGPREDRDEKSYLQHAPPRPVAPHQPVPGINTGQISEQIRPQGRKNWA